MNSKQGSRYIKSRMGNELRNKILEYNGIVMEPGRKVHSNILTCPRCEFINIPENKFCSKCSYPLNLEAFNEIKSSEEEKMRSIQQKHEQDISNLKSEMNEQFAKIMKMIQQNPLLANVKNEVLEKF